MSELGRVRIGARYVLSRDIPVTYLSRTQVRVAVRIRPMNDQEHGAAVVSAADPTTLELERRCASTLFV